MLDHDRPLLRAGCALRDWYPELPPLDLRTLVLHWTAGDDATVYPAYHFVVTPGQGEPRVHAASPLAANARDVRIGEDAYAAHVAGRNSHAIGIALAGMRDARPEDFGPYAIDEPGIAALCTVASVLARAYAIPVTPHRVFTHAEAAVWDGYFGAGEEERWDIARLATSPEPLLPADARRVGDALRARILACAERG